MPYSSKQKFSRPQGSTRGKDEKFLLRHSRYATALSRRIRIRRHLSVKSHSQRRKTNVCPLWRLMRLQKLSILGTLMKQQLKHPEEKVDTMRSEAIPQTRKKVAAESIKSTQERATFSQNCLFFFDVVGETRPSSDGEHVALAPNADTRPVAQDTQQVVNNPPFHVEQPLQKHGQSVSHTGVRDYSSSPFPCLAEYQDLPKRSNQSSIRYYTPGSKLQTDDGYLTKHGCRTQCFLCGEIHKAWDCPQGRCFSCFESGHDSRSCPNKNVYCGGCSARGHHIESCPRNAFGLASRSSLWDSVRCLHCGSKGHLNCSTLESLGDNAKCKAERVQRQDKKKRKDDSWKNWRQDESWDNWRQDESWENWRQDESWKKYQHQMFGGERCEASTIARTVSKEISCGSSSKKRGRYE